MSKSPSLSKSDQCALRASVCSSENQMALLDICESLSALGKEVDKSEVLLPDGALRQTGEYEIDVRLDSDVTVSVNLAIIEQ